MKTTSALAVLACVLLRPVPAPAEPEPVPGGWTLVSIPDTQNYVTSGEGTAIFAAETQWIAEQADAWNILFATQVGDLVDDNGDTQWARARDSLAVLEGLVPFALCTGNHDCGPGGNGQSRDSQFSDPLYFGPGSGYTAQPSFRGYFQHPNDPPGRTENAWHTFTAGNQPFLVLTCEWGPRDAVVAWMATMAEAHPFHRVVVVVHAYLENGSRRFDWDDSPSGSNPHAFDLDDDPDGTNDGEEIWNGFVRSHRNVALVLCGHAGRAFRTVTGDAGNAVHEMLYNTQDLPEGGNGWLRLLHFYPDGRTVRALTYSPHLGTWDRSSSDEFTFHLDPVSESDTDQDGLPDWYEAQHQFDPDVPDALLDADGDGTTNRAEFLASTHPRDPASILRTTTFERRESEVELRWESVPGLTYRVESNGTLNPAEWRPEHSVTAHDILTGATIPDSGARRFFRIVVE